MEDRTELDPSEAIPANGIISDHRLREFQDAYKQDFGDNISLRDARKILSRLVALYEFLAHPIPKPEDSSTAEERLPLRSS